MKDFNFFDPYMGGRKDFKKEYLYAVVLSMVLVLVIAFAYAFNYFKISKLNSEVASIQQNLNSKENIVKLKEIEKEDKKINIMNQYYGKAVTISKSINSKNFVGTAVIDKINSCVPEDVYFKVMSLDASGMQLEAEGQDREKIAVFERALRNLDFIKDVHVVTIKSDSTENKNLIFVINCTVKDVDNNESN